MKGKGKERKGKERKGKERKGKERKGKERKGYYGASRGPAASGIALPRPADPFGAIGGGGSRLGLASGSADLTESSPECHRRD